MVEPSKRARELLAAEYHAGGIKHGPPNDILNGNEAPDTTRALRAIDAALALSPPDARDGVLEEAEETDKQVIREAKRLAAEKQDETRQIQDWGDFIREARAALKQPLTGGEKDRCPNCGNRSAGGTTCCPLCEAELRASEATR